ncbi:MAG: DUF2061 domain-containing protein [Steroidobacteraceae bacterium]
MCNERRRQQDDVLADRLKRHDREGEMMTTASRKRSVVKAATYRIVIVCLDFLVIYLLTGHVRVALGFMIISNVYTTLGYFVHERIWAHVKWGTEAEPVR